MSKSPSNLPYRPCVGIILLNADGLVFAGRRNDASENAWQMPQGGIDEGEKPGKAARRELLEEIGNCNATIIGESEDWLRYDLPENLVGKVWKGKYRGQEQRWFVMRFRGEDRDINLNATGHPEFSEWRWIPFEDLPNLVVSFKKNLYGELLRRFRHLAVPE